MASRIHREVYVRFWEGFGQTYGSNAARRLIPTLRGQGGRSVLDEGGNAFVLRLAGLHHFEGAEEDRNMNTLVDMISGMEVKEDDEDFLNAVDYMFKGLEQRKPNCFAVKQYKKFKLSSGDICSK